MNSESFDHLLYRLCTELGFFLPPEARNALVAVPPIDALRATEAVFRAEGMDPELGDRRLFRQVHSIVSEAYYGEARLPEVDRSAPSVVTIVLDGEYGSRLWSLDRGAIWIADSPTNKSVAEEIWRVDQSRSITTFRDLPIRAGWEALAQILPEVELHHGVLSQDPPYDRLEVIGCRPNQAAVRTLVDFGFELEQPTADGFIGRRSNATTV